ncbi:DUF4652 domain-containing protein [Priestia filamentosa]|uniref:DUF4652 domain-containing protein n=1 Tax=Priestia filamentosa TaxID=1402861 RepID=UPI0039829A54
MFNVIYSQKNQVIHLKNERGIEEVIPCDSPSMPIKSPNSKSCIFISPYEMDSSRSLYQINLETGEIEEVIPPSKENNVAKKALWLDDNRILVIIGLAYGTVSLGGDLYIYNFGDNSLLPVIENESDESEIVDFEFNNELLRITIRTFIDDIKNQFKEEIREFSIRDILENN